MSDLSKTAAIMAASMALAQQGASLGVPYSKMDEFDPFDFINPMAEGRGKSNHGGRKSHVNRDKAKAARKARRRNRK